MDAQKKEQSFLGKWINPKLILIIVAFFVVQFPLSFIIYDFSLKEIIQQLYPEFLGAILTYVVVQGLIVEKENESERKLQLKIQLRSIDPGMSHYAAIELQTRGWLHDGTLRGISLEKANLRKINLEKGNFERANFNEADLREANLIQADLREATFRETKLEGAKLQRASFVGADFYKMRS
jgi:uncharacterized protein YjbI with pentapeptide repeats